MPPADPSRSTTSDIDFVHEYAVAADRFANAVADADLRAAVPTCPGWTTYDLIVHLGNVHAWAATIVETGRPANEQTDVPRTRRPGVVGGWYLGKAEDLLAVLRAAPPDQACWNFAFGSGVVGFWPRRQLHETLIHLVDLDLTVGRPTDIPQTLAADGVAEVLGVFLHRMHRRHPAELTAPLTLVAEDADRAWTVTPADPPSDPPRVAHREVPHADRVQASADALFRLLWGRLAVDDPTVTVTGDQDRVGAFLASRLVP